MRVAVTGASGFVGKHIVSDLLGRNVELVIASRHPQLVPVAAGAPATTIALDLADLEAAFERLGRPDVLLHLAWGGLPNYRSQLHVQEELPKHIEFLDACIRGGLRRLVVAGTCLEYGMQSGCVAEHFPAAPVTAYGEAKDRLHRHLQNVASNANLQLTWLRLFYVYGPGQAPTSLYSQLRAALDGGAKEFRMSPGDQIRDFLPIERAAAQINQLVLGAQGAGAVNICSGVGRTVEETVRTWLRNWNCEIRLELGAYPYPDYEPRAFWGSTEKLHALIGAA